MIFSENIFDIKVQLSLQKTYSKLKANNNDNNQIVTQAIYSIDELKKMIIIINNEIPENENPKKLLIFFNRVIKFNKEQEEQDLKH